MFNRSSQHSVLASDIMHILYPGYQTPEEPVSPRNEEVLQFLRGEQVPKCCHHIDAVANFSDYDMERYHDFIQWIFPTMEQSMAHPDAPTIDSHFAEELHQDSCALAGYCKGCRRYLRYMGLECEGNANITSNPDTRPFWELPHHNFLRITRALNSLRQTGHDACSKALYSQMMQDLKEEPRNFISRTTLLYWMKTQRRTLQEEGITNAGFLGAFVGDIVGSIYERHNTKRTDFPLFSDGSRFTDDSVMTVAVADWLLDSPRRTQYDLEGKLVMWGGLYPHAGYGGAFSRWLHAPAYLGKFNKDGSLRFDDSSCRQPYNSFGNGSAMRCSACAWVAHSQDEALEIAYHSAKITHNHPEGLKGAQAVVAAIYLARQGESKEAIRKYIIENFGYDLSRTCDDIRPGYNFDVTCQGSVPEAIIAFLDSSSFEDAIRLAVSLGGDSDTIACITGSIAGAFYKEIPDYIVEEVCNRLPDDMWSVIKQILLLK